MSPKKITDADKLEIVALYRQGGETTASLANRFGVSNSTVSRLLKTMIPEAEYDRLIQRKRGSKVNNESESLATPDESPMEHDELAAASVILGSIDPQVMTDQVDAEETASIDDIFTLPFAPIMTEDPNTNARRVRRRSSAPDESISVAELPQVEQAIDPESIDLLVEPPNSVPTMQVLPSLDRSTIDFEFSSPMSQDGEILDEEEEEEVEADVEAVNALAEMFGEEIAVGEEDEDDFEDEEELTAEEAANPYQKLDPDRLLTGDKLHIRVTPLSQATLPRTCYIVIDKFAELIVRPLKDFADLGQIPGDEIQQRTLPIFDNHRVAKRFSNQRTQRVIKVPDSKVFQKTCHHLRMKGITRLLVDGSIYSLN